MSYACGAYTIYFTYMIARNHSPYYIKYKFSKNKKCYDSLLIVTKFFFLKTETQITFNSQYCSFYMFQNNVEIIVPVNYRMCIMYILRSKYVYILLI